MNGLGVVSEQERSLLLNLHIAYTLHALGMAAGAIGAATVLGSFIFGWPSIIGVGIAYWHRSAARGSWMHTHIEWQIRTFWFAVGWTLLVVITGTLTLFIYVGIFIWLIGFVALSLWAIYRVGKGWLRLYKGVPAYAMS